jgi:hypothetical protein
VFAASGLGFGPAAIRVGGQHFEAMQIRLSPVVARAVVDDIAWPDRRSSAESIDDLTAVRQK